MNVNMSKEKIEQLLKAVGSRPQTDDSSIECTDYNWNEPHYFSNDQLAKLDIFVQNLSVVISEKFSAFCRAEFEVEIISVSQHYMGAFLAEKEDNQNNDYYLTFGSGAGKEFGVLEIPENTASLWSKQLLGDSDSNEGQETELSQLELSLLCDIASVLVSAFSVVNSKIESNPAANIVAGQFPVKIKENQEICRISLCVWQKGSEVKSNASFIIPCAKLEVVTGKNKYSQNESAEKDFSKIIIEHLGSIPISITAQLATSQFSFEDVMNLQVNDIVLLDKQIDEPVDLLINKHVLGCGRPVMSDGKYAIQITATDF